MEQDTKLIGQTLELGKGCILLINKWDLRQNKPEAMGKFRSELQRRLPFVTYVPTLFISALTGKLVAKIFPLIDRVMTGYTLRIATGDLNRFFEAVTNRHPPPLHRGRRVKLFYFTQTGVRPPLFVTFSNQPAGVSDTYRRYLENQLRASFGFEGVPLRIKVRKRR